MSSNSFFLASDIQAEYAIFEHHGQDDIIEIVDSLFPKDGFIVVHVYVFEGNQPGMMNTSTIRQEWPTNHILSRSPIPCQIQILAIRKNDIERFEYIKRKGNHIGIYLESSENRALFLDDMEAGLSDFQLSMNLVYDELFGAILEHGFQVKDILKFWNYIPGIVEKYKEFNVVRDFFFEKYGVTPPYPAGTGIDCLLYDNALSHASCQLLSSKKGSLNISPLKTDKQCEAEYYGPKFSRAINVTHSTGDVLFISGTAAVGPKGETLYSDDIVSNISFTMNTVGGLLEEAQMDFSDIKSSFVYLKRAEYLPYFLDHYHKNQWGFPFIYTVCDVCRDDWLFEFECIAATKKDQY